MLKKLLESPLSLVLVLIAFCGLGIYSLFTLPVKMYPDMVKPSFRVGFGNSDIATAEGIYRAYGKQIIEQIAELPGIVRYGASYHARRGQIEIEFDWDSDEEKIKEKLINILVSASDDPNRYWKYVNSMGEQSSANMMVAVGHSKLDTDELFTLLESSLLPKLNKIKNVTRANLWGHNYKKVVLLIDRDKLLSFNITISNISSVIKSGLNSYVAGRIGSSKSRQNKIQLTVAAKIDRFEDLLDLPIMLDFDKSGKSSKQIKLGQIATIDTIEHTSTSLYRLNGVDAQFLNVRIGSVGDVKNSCDQAREIITKFTGSHPGTSFNILVNPATFIGNATENLLINGLIGGFTAVLIILLFLGSMKNSLIIGISIPFCVVTSFVLMKFFSISINIISLGGMAISLGMILDGSIVTLENIFRNFSNGNDNKLDTIINSVREVFLPLVMSVLTSIVVFLPIIYTKSYTQAILGDLARTVIFTLSTSVIASLVIVPLFASRTLSRTNSVSNKKSAMTEKLLNIYKKILEPILKSQKNSMIVLILTVVIFLLSLLLFSSIKKELIAIPETKLLDIRGEFGENEDLDLTSKKVKEVEDFLRTKSEVVNFSTYFWRASDGYITAELKSRSMYKEMKEFIEKKFPPNPEVRFTAQKWDPGKLPLPRKRDMALTISGASKEELTAFSDELIEFSSKFKVYIWRKPWINKSEEIRISFNPLITNSDKDSLQEAIRAATSQGIYITDFFVKEKLRSVYLQYPEKFQAIYIEDVKNLPVRYAGKIVPLKAVAKVEFKKERMVPIHFYNDVLSQELNINTNDKRGSIKAKDALRKFKKHIDKVAREKGVAVDYLNPNEEMDKSIESFVVSLLISVLLVFLVVALLFNSLKYPLIIVSTIPIAFTGVLVGLKICSSTISLNSMLGTILLSGLVVNNAILLIDFYLKEKRNSSLENAILTACMLRFRPIIMTTLTTLLGAVPIAIGLGESGEILRPLGIAIFFGLFVSTALTLFFIPALLRIFK